MRASNKLRRMTTVIYRLKRDYGESIDLYHQTNETIDLKTGRKTVVKVKQQIKRAILLPSRVASDFAKQITTDKNLKYQGLFDSSQRIVVIDKSDLKTIFKILTTSDWIIFDHQRWEISEIDEFEQDIAYWIIMKQIKGAPVYEVQEFSIKDRFSFTERVS